MNAGLAELVADRFAAFAAPYLAEPGDGFAYQLKIDHTARVVDLARRICTEEALQGDTAQAALLAAQLHDLGRFPQYRQYHTFRDADSANHAALSVTHVLRARVLEGAAKALRRTVLGAVYLHNKRNLPSGLPPRLDAAARVVRDSDKLDIYQVMLDYFAQDTPKHPEVALSVKEHPTAYSPAVLECLLARSSGDYAQLVWVNDFKLMTVGWLYDINFRSAFKILSERGYLDAVFASLPDEPGIRRVRAQAMDDLAQRVRGA
jgi:hypothetical protein